jgi:hypothetical protein
MFLGAALNLSAASDSGRISGKILDPQNVAVAGARLKLINSAGSLVRETTSDTQGKFTLEAIDAGEYQLKAESNNFVSVVADVSLAAGQQKEVDLQFQQLASVLQAITVVASSPSLLTPDPAQTVVIHDQVLDANPGRPGRRFPSLDFPLKPRPVESKHHSISRRVLQEIMASRSLSFFKLATFSIQTTFLPMPMAMATPIRMS